MTIKDLKERLQRENRLAFEDEDDGAMRMDKWDTTVLDTVTETTINETLAWVKENVNFKGIDALKEQGYRYAAPGDDLFELLTTKDT